jgi:proline dehydrogenase
MKLWQRIMIYLARNQALKGFMQGHAAMSQLATRFVGGKDAAHAIRTGQELKSQGRSASFFYLGEYVEELSVIDRTVLELKTIIGLLRESNLDVHVSVDPTQLGYQIDEKICHDNVLTIAAEIGKAFRPEHGSGSFMMLDMEDSSVTDATLRLYDKLNATSLPVAVTLQAYLFRTEADLRKIVERRGAVRLVKGALAEGKEIAWTRRSSIDDSYRKLAGIMLSAPARRNGFYPIFATHDHVLIGEIIELAGKLGWEKDEYEFEMLYGVRPELQDQLVRGGQRLRLYLPFGTDWWPYAVRRVGENPRNAQFLLRSVLGI